MFRKTRLLVALALSGIALYGQAAVGRISGQIFDSSQGVIPGAKVISENTGTGIKRDTLADGQGRFSFPDLSTGSYKVTVEAPGFKSEVRNNITLTVASNLTLDFSLSAGQVTEVIQVTETATPVEANAAQGAYFNNKQLIDLPINGRDYGRFSLLSPGAVARSNFISDMAFNGLHSTSNNFTIDGVDGSRVDQPYMANGFERGARLLTGSLETIGEVRVQTGNYKAEYGRSAGSSVAIVTRSGTNDMHGSLFNFFRNDFLDARNFFNTKPNRMAPFRYNNFGANLAGPIFKNKTFFLVNYEGSRQRVGIVGSQTVPSALLRQQVLTASPALRTIIEQFPLGQTPIAANPLVDTWTGIGVSNVREDTGSVRVDHNISDKDKIFARFNLNDSETFGPLFGVTAAAVGLTDFQQVPVTTTNATLSYSRVWNPYVVMELNAGLQRWGSQLNSETDIPQTSITGISAIVGSRRFSRTNSQVNQYGGSVSIVRGAHTIKAGGTLWHSGTNPYSRGLTQLNYTSIEDFINNRLATITLINGDPGSGRRQDHVGVYAQDTWQLRPGLTIDYGLRYDIGTPNHGNDDRYRAFDTRTMTLGTPGDDWYAMNKKNFAPRLAVSFQPYKKLVIRTGYGIFYQQYAVGFGYSVPLNTIPGNTTILRANVPDLAYPFIPNSGGTVALPNVEGYNWNKPELYTQQWNFTLVHELPGQTSLQVAYVGNRGINMRRARNINFLDPALGRRPIAGFANVNVEFNDGQSVYHGLQVNLTRRYSSGVMGTFNYTYAKVIDNTMDYGLYSTQPQDNRCMSGCERGLGSGDVRHNVTYNAVYDLPFGKGKKFLGTASGAADKILGGWQLSSLALMRSGIANNIVMGVNTFGNANFTNQRPNVVAGQDLFPTNQTINNWYNTAAFSLPTAGTFGNAARNVGRGPDFFQFDSSVTKNTKLSERVNLRFRGEVFNIFNRPNFDFPNATFGTAAFGRIQNTFGRTIGFGTSRQIQLSMRLMF